MIPEPTPEPGAATVAPPEPEEETVAPTADPTSKPLPAGEDPAVVASVEEAAKEMTLDEWKMQELNQRSIPRFNLRQPGEGEDTAGWGKLYRLSNKKGEGEDMEEEEDLAKKGRPKQLVDIQINFVDSRRGPRGRGGSARGRGARGGGGGGSSAPPQAPDPPQLAPKVDDWNDFPSLLTA